MGRPARIVLHLLRTSVDVPVPGWMKSESKLFAKLESCEQQNWPTPEKGAAQLPDQAQCVTSNLIPGIPLVLLHLVLNPAGVKDGPETIPYLVEIQ